MKHIALPILIALICGSCATHDPIRLGKFDGDVHMLRHEIAYSPAHADKDAYFMATLTNLSNQDSRVMVDDQGFHSTLTVRPATGQKYEVFEKKYLHLLLTASWIDPTVELAAGRTIHWKVPLSSMVTLHGEPVTQNSLRGATIISELSASGATLKSKPIHIPKEG